MYALQAIETKYHGPTNFRITARAEAGRITVSYPCELSGVACHAYAAQKLAEKLGWTGNWHAGGTKTGYVFVCVLAPVGPANGTLAFTVTEEPNIRRR